MTKRLTELTKTSGWAAKIGPDVLAQVLCHLPKMEDEKLLVGLETSDDAAVYKIDEDKAMIQTLDFFTPVVDDPYTFGQIAATNSLSDVYAMGGEPKLAMNIVCFPDCLDPSVLSEILKGGYDKVKEAGALIVGGHSVSDDEPKYGLSITGFIHPNNILTNSNAQVGDYLILTKPIGLGIINTAIKGQMIDKEVYDEAVHVMTTLNKYGKEAIDKVGGVSSITDITGFGLLGHALEMAAGSDVTIRIFSDKVPIIKGTKELAEMGLVPAGRYSNEAYLGEDINLSEDISEIMEDILFDPQTSGGLLISVSEDKIEELGKELDKTPTNWALIGKVEELGDYKIIVE